MSLDQVATLFAILGAGCGFIVIGAGVLWLAARYSQAAEDFKQRLLVSIEGRELTFAWVVALVSTLGSLYLSEIGHLEPCKWCWFQRIAMYPLAVILGIAAWRKDIGIRLYSYPLAAAGAVFAAYHYSLQQFPNLSTGACSVFVPCDTPYFMKFGFISLPLMALAGFALILVLLAATHVSAAPEADSPQPELERTAL